MAKSVVTNVAKGKMVKARAGMGVVPKITGMAFGDGAGGGNGGRAPFPTDTALQHELLRQDVDGAALQDDGISVLYTCTLAKATMAGETINEVALVDADGDLVAIKTFADKGKDGDMEMAFSVLDKFAD